AWRAACASCAAVGAAAAARAGAAPPSAPGFQAANDLTSSRGMKRPAVALARCRGSSEELIGSTARQHDLPLVDQATHDLQHFLLFCLDLGHAHRAARIEV